MKKFNIEIAVGLFLVLSFLCFAYISIKLGNLNLFGNPTYQVVARFESISGLKVGANIEIAGVKVGRVAAIHLDQDDYEAVVNLEINNKTRIQEDSIASIRSAGIIGDKYVSISPGGSDDYLKAGDEITETESAINIEELISKYIFEKD
ncbi:outer membrane lipid asymmetry maintenance protein MlaD [Geothermobacter hydrogeniphilus]|uniref:Outer membrane lipid asymmetry maintenance protein MlaD n=1 Tax=Geothermobacter hydrogeniphilus TaxID=1969733 RepID=A0A1X0YCT0_9BACT|nr:outer membrane lipid asymmetry maintenance protein MlaD [Geothermobacter hydrogeniphilus]ORJ62926.1 outer membrane lipid asymmetry maintenance protein MlaD [Geothermobacter hydrogeniphilus]